MLNRVEREWERKDTSCVVVEGPLMEAKVAGVILIEDRSKHKNPIGTENDVGGKAIANGQIRWGNQACGTS